MEQTKEMVKWLQTTPSSQNRPVLRDVTSIEEVRDHQSTSPGQQQRMLPVLDSDYLPTLGEKGPEALASFEELIKICCHLSEGNELKTAERILWACLPRVENIAKLSFECQQEAANITSQGYLLAASLAGHRNDLQTRHQFSEQALLYGKLAQDHNLQLGALRQISITFDYLERPDKVLQIYQQILPYLHQTSPLLQACIYAGVSGAYAQRKQKQEAFRFIRMAYESFPVHHENEPDFLNIMCRYSTLVFFDGLNYLELGQPREAEKVFAQIDGLQPKISIPARVRVELLNYQVETFIALKEVEKACLYIQSAANDAYGIGSEKRFAEAKKLFANMQELWPHEPRVKQLEEIFVC
ncbi:MAG TPA: hypothetical protein VFV38_18465 [Ktedonobacteraceae bacterium]|nr:hypothetical protein [Ktedonobacteraceae bacterium]